MIPLKLELTNFLSYRNTATVDFTGVHLACISGANGAGKSSLLEAITWALFGKSRSRSDDDVVNRAAAAQGDSAEIRFQFALEDTAYRVIRRKKAGGRAALEFQIGAADGGWKTLSEARLRETQAAIEHTLRMNYDTFVNASFFLQGQADAFTTKTAGQRKEILADLLGVSQWDTYRDAVAERRKLAENELMLLDGRLQDIADELAEQEERNAQLRAAQADAARLKTQLDGQEVLLGRLRHTAEQARQQEKQLRELLATRQHTENERSAALARLAQRQTDRDRWQAWLDRAEEIEAAQAKLVSAEKERDQWQERADAVNALRQTQRPHELAIAAARSRLTQQQDALQQQAERVAALRDERDKQTARHAAAAAEQTRLQSELAAVAEDEAEGVQQRDAQQAILQQRAVWQQELKTLHTQRAQVAARLAEKPPLHANLAEATAMLERLAIQVAEAQEKRQRLSDCNAELRTVQAAQPDLKTQVDELKERIDRLSAETGGACPLCAQPLTPEHRDTVLQDLNAKGKRLADTYRANRARIGDLQQEITQLTDVLNQSRHVENEAERQRKRHTQIESRLDAIKQFETQWAADGGPERIADLESRLVDDAELQRLEARLATLRASVGRKRGLEQKLQTAQRTIAQTEARLNEIDAAVTAWEADGKPTLHAVQAQLDSDAFELEARAALADLNAQIEAVGYDAAAHDGARQAVADLAHVPEQVQQVQQARAALPHLEDSLADLAQQIASADAQLIALTQQEVEAQARVAALQADAADLPAIETEVYSLRDKHLEAERFVGNAEQRVSVLDERRKQESTLTGQRAELTVQIGRLKRLEEACGRNGVQALLIERALPEIEDSANTILDRLTSGQMRITFETQRKLKSRDELAETLDIHIVDGVGERPYENYSGGEQFRINFAIRLALSQILAKRAGARLQTLVIDEGFGSQDPSGRQRLVEAINAIQADFERVLVITHIDELRDVFPTRIDVTKSADGSQVTVQ